MSLANLKVGDQAVVWNRSYPMLVTVTKVTTTQIHITYGNPDNIIKFRIKDGYKVSAASYEHDRLTVLDESYTKYTAKKEVEKRFFPAKERLLSNINYNLPIETMEKIISFVDEVFPK